MDHMIARANDKLVTLDSDEKMRQLYEYREKAALDYNSDMSGAREEGERNKAIEIAKEMLRDGESIEKISKYTQLSVAEIAEIKQELN